MGLLKNAYVIASLVTILVLVFGDFFCVKELFIDNHIMNFDKTVLYNVNGMYKFYSSGSPASLFKVNSGNVEIVKLLLAFYSNFQDMACTSLSQSIDDEQDTKRVGIKPLCTNYFVDVNSSLDTYFESLSFKERRCTNVKSITSNNMTNSLIRVLGNYYNLMKRCVVLDNVSFERMMSGPDSESYYVTITGPIGSILLSRPTYIAFDNFGLFSVSPTQDYDTTITTNQLLMTRVMPYKGLHMYSDKHSSISEATKTITAMPCVIYYLNYNNKVKVSSSIDIASTLTLIFSKRYLNSHSVTNVSIPTNFSNINTTVVAGSVNILYDPKILDMTQRFSIVVAYGTPVTNLPFTLPRELCYAIANGEDFHIIMTYTLDLMILVGLTKSVTYFTQHPVTDGMNYVMLKYSIPLVTTVLQSASLDLEMNKHAPLVGFTAIPNFSLLGKHLGYDI